MSITASLRSRFFWVCILAVAFAYVEASVVVYLRALYYPDGFRLPLRLLSTSHVSIELGREAATIVMLAAVALLAGGTRWKRFGYFMFGFGIWDIGFYCWLKLFLSWPSSITDWDVLFLLPVPWIGPVIAPVLISCLLIACGVTIIVRLENGAAFKPTAVSRALAIVGSAFMLVSFMEDTPATLEGMLPQPYHYAYLFAGLFSCLVALLIACRTTSPPSS